MKGKLATSCRAGLKDSFCLSSVPNCLFSAVYREDETIGVHSSGDSSNTSFFQSCYKSLQDLLLAPTPGILLFEANALEAWV